MPTILSALLFTTATAFSSPDAAAQKSMSIEAMIAAETDPEEKAALQEIQRMNKKAEAEIAAKSAEPSSAAKEKKTGKQQSKKESDEADVAFRLKCRDYREKGIFGTRESEIHDVARCLMWGKLIGSTSKVSPISRTTHYHFDGGKHAMFVNGKLYSYTE